MELALLDIVDILAVTEEFDFTKEVSLINNTSVNLKIFLKKSESSFIKTISVNDRH